MAPRGGLARRSGSSTASSRIGTPSDASHEDPVHDRDLQLHEDDSVGLDIPTTRWSLQKMENGHIAAHPKMSSTITKIFHQVQNPTGFSWKLTPQEIKDKYFDEFRKYFSWPSDWESVVREKWESRARVRYSDFLHDVKELRGENNAGRPLYISEDMWTGLCRYWDLPEVKARSEAARKCRMSTSLASGTIPGTHKGGSKAVEILAQQMAKEKGIPIEKCIYPSFRSIHLKEDGTYTTQKAADIDAKVQEIAREQGEGADLSKIFIEVNGGGLNKKQRMYGTGSLAVSLLSDGSSSSASYHSQLHSKEQCASRFGDLKQELQTEREERRRLEELFQATQSLVQQLLAKQQNSDPESSPRDHE